MFQVKLMKMIVLIKAGPIFNLSLFSVTFTECKRAVVNSQGNKEIFSTGSQNHQPPQPNS